MFERYRDILRNHGIQDGGGVRQVERPEEKRLSVVHDVEDVGAEPGCDARVEDEPSSVRVELVEERAAAPGSSSRTG